MTTFPEIIHFFSEKMKASPPEEEIIEGQVALYVNEVPVSIIWKEEFKGLLIEAEMGFFLSKIPQHRLQLLATRNFLGLETFGKAFCLGENGITLKFTKVLTAGVSAGECWEELLNFLDAYQHFFKEIKRWPEFTPIFNSGEDDQTGSIPNYQHILG
jgi:hypothetical protein